MTAQRTITRLTDLEDWPSPKAGETISVDADGRPIVVSSGGGTRGPRGATWFTGSGAPGDALGVEDDLYLDTDTGDVYKKAGASWQ